jgi:hypothetical protein
MAGERGSMLLTAMLFAAGIALVLGSYLTLSRTSLKVAQRTFFANDAANLAEAGLEEALYCFKQMEAGTAAATAWNGWTFSGANAMRTLTPFNRDQNAIGVTKIYVKGYDGTDAAPYVIAQATVTPFDGGAPIIKTVHLVIRRSATTLAHGLVALTGLDLNNSAFADSFNSNPSASPTGPWLNYSSSIARSGASVVVLGGTVEIASGKVYGNLYLGPGVAAPSSADYTGTVTTNYSATFPFPVYPTTTSVSRSYSLGSTIPGLLPRVGDLPASDGRYYYFCSNTTIRNFVVTANRKISIIGTTTGMTSGITLPTTSSLHVYMDRALVLSGGADLNVGGWAGNLRIYTTTTLDCTIANNSQLVAWFQAPNAELRASGNNSSNMLVGFFLAKFIFASGSMDFHFDESLQPVAAAATYDVTRWLDFQSAADRATVSGLTGGYLR